MTPTRFAGALSKMDPTTSSDVTSTVEGEVQLRKLMTQPYNTVILQGGMLLFSAGDRPFSRHFLAWMMKCFTPPSATVRTKFGDSPHEVGSELWRLVVVDTQPAFHRDRQSARVGDAADALPHQLWFAHQRSTEFTLTSYSVGWATAVQIYLVITPRRNDPGSATQILWIAATQLAHDGMFIGRKV
eukprot:CAMPEP_0194556016 /NCGR_PEP_ID=MMETSP0253-20130528/98531_1 /TAXON_ID=2966 /ORGANISM="Noctiluca scintillans" /LENGTH=185 /DNA_ID=CAMNT_0039403517 /DNA_START=888 /DNA_END=1445 /DNA_ORIENTATION=-